jgi:5-deoxy-glucuronate isomerase
MTHDVRPGSSSPLLRPATTEAGGMIQAITPADAGWAYVSFEVRQLAAGERHERPGDAQEVLVLILEGEASVRAGDKDFGPLGTRLSVFDGPPPPVVLVAPGGDVSVTAMAGALVAVAAAPGGPVRHTATFAPPDVLVESRGSANTARRIHHLLPPAVEAGRLIAYEVFTPGGNWSSYPPHKHDTEDPPREAQLEELYFYRFARPQGFALQRVYTADRVLDELVVAHDLDVVLVPRGYHMVGAPSGYDCYYLNVMAGPKRAWHFSVDPDHAWLMNWDPAVPTTQ